MINETKLKLLEQIVSNGLEGVILPYKKGNSIRIGHVVIRKSQRNEYNLYDTRENKRIGSAFSINSAVAIAKNYAENDYIPSEVLRLDAIIEKYSNDIVHYQHTIKITNSSFKKDLAEVRIECARDEAERARNELDRFIFS